MDKYPVCNHKSETAPIIYGMPFVLCWRCTGVLVAFFIMGAIRFFMKISFGVSQLLIGIFTVLPMVVDGIMQYYFMRKSSNKRRFITGFLFGIGFALMLFMFY